MGKVLLGSGRVMEFSSEASFQYIENTVQCSFCAFNVLPSYHCVKLVSSAKY